MATKVLWISAKEIDQLGITMSEIMDAAETGFAAIGRGGAALKGIASHDIMTAAPVYDRAVKAGLGTRVEL